MIDVSIESLRQIGIKTLSDSDPSNDAGIVECAETLKTIKKYFRLIIANEIALEKRNVDVFNF